MDSFLVSTGIVALAEIGDKTQLLALVLAARYRSPMAIILGIFLATVANHMLAAWFGAEVVGVYLAQWMGNIWAQVALGASFLAMAAWILVPDAAPDDDDDAAQKAKTTFFAICWATLLAFFVVEIGDKTQVATIGLAARFDSVLLVTLGTTTGMMLANVPAVLIGDAAAHKIPLPLVRTVAALIFAVMGGMMLYRALTA